LGAGEGDGDTSAGGAPSSVTTVAGRFRFFEFFSSLFFFFFAFFFFFFCSFSSEVEGGVTDSASRFLFFFSFFFFFLVEVKAASVTGAYKTERKRRK
jgi:hypothetical protein